MLDNMEYGGGGGAFPPFADPGPLFCVASKRIGVARVAYLALLLSNCPFWTRAGEKESRRWTCCDTGPRGTHHSKATSQTQADPLIVFCAGVTKKQLDEVMLTLDKNGDGEIKFDEFAEW